MPRKMKDPISVVMQYFETVPIEVARTSLEVASEIIRRRSTRGPTQPRASAGNGQAAAAPAPTPAPPGVRRRRQAATTGATALPGPPPAQVGD